MENERITARDGAAVRDADLEGASALTGAVAGPSAAAKDEIDRICSVALDENLEGAKDAAARVTAVADAHGPDTIAETRLVGAFAAPEALMAARAASISSKHLY